MSLIQSATVISYRRRKGKFSSVSRTCRNAEQVLVVAVALGKNSEPGAASSSNFSGVQRFFPLGTEHPRERGHSTAKEAPLKVVPAQVVAAVLCLDARSRSFRCFQDRLLFFGRIRPAKSS
jgi:hypothetical protein